MYKYVGYPFASYILSSQLAIFPGFLNVLHVFHMRCKDPPDSFLDAMEYISHCFIRDASYRMSQGDSLCLLFVSLSNLCRGYVQDGISTITKIREIFLLPS